MYDVLDKAKKVAEIPELGKICQFTPSVVNNDSPVETINRLGIENIINCRDLAFARISLGLPNHPLNRRIFTRDFMVYTGKGNEALIVINPKEDLKYILDNDLRTFSKLEYEDREKDPENRRVFALPQDKNRWNWDGVRQRISIEPKEGYWEIIQGLLKDQAEPYFNWLYQYNDKRDHCFLWSNYASELDCKFPFAVPLTFEPYHIEGTIVGEGQYGRFSTCSDASIVWIEKK